VARLIYGHRADNLSEAEASAKLKIVIEEQESKRKQIEERLLRTLGPRKINDAKRERMSALVRELLPNSSFLIFVCKQKNNEDQKEALDFAWQLADIFRCPVCSTNEETPWEVEDVMIRPSILDSDEVKIATARNVFGILKLEKIAVHGPVPAMLPSQYVYTLERDPPRIATFFRSDDVLRALLIVVGKRSQPVFRLDGSDEAD
jgi:hypothetical protein